MMYKKILTLTMAALLAISATACKNQKPQESGVDSATEVATTVADTTESETETTAKATTAKSETAKKNDASQETADTSSTESTDAETAPVVIDEKDVDDLDAIEPEPTTEEVPDETNGEPVYDEDGYELL